MGNAIARSAIYSRLCMRGEQRRIMMVREPSPAAEAACCVWLHVLRCW